MLIMVYIHLPAFEVLIFMGMRFEHFEIGCDDFSSPQRWWNITEDDITMLLILTEKSGEFCDKGSTV